MLRTILASTLALVGGRLFIQAVEVRPPAASVPVPR
jgi:hypothetical protein